MSVVGARADFGAACFLAAAGGAVAGGRGEGSGAAAAGAAARAADGVVAGSGVMMLTGGVHRDLPPGTKVVLSSMFIRNRLAPNVSDEQRESLTARFGEQFRLYLRDMGVEPELLDIINRNPEPRRATELPPTEWTRLNIVTAPSP